MAQNLDWKTDKCIQTDHLNTPRLIQDQNGNAVWRNDNTEPFGDSVPNGDPNNTGTAFEFPLRFSGQYFDRETGLSYNFFRDYDPRIGRYVQSDPIGLSGGINTFGYVWLSPLRFFDSYGLECWWLDQGYKEICDPTGLRRQKPTEEYQVTQWFPAPDPKSPQLDVGPTPPLPGGQIIWRWVFKEKGYWEIEMNCHVQSVYVCRDECGKETFFPAQRKWKRWDRGEDYDEVTGYGHWSNIGAPPGPYDLEGGPGSGRPGSRPGLRPGLMP